LYAVLSIFGVVDPLGRRKVLTAWLEYARKNGKSEFAAAIALALLLADGESYPEVYLAAYNRIQAGIVFKVAEQMVRLDPTLMSKCKLLPATHVIVAKSSYGFIKAIPADAPSVDGFNASGIIFDEVARQPNSELWDVLEDSKGTREQPLTFAITYAGHDKMSLAGQLHDYASQVARGVIDDPSWYVDIRSVPEDADWRDEDLWRIANPGLGTEEEIAAGTAFKSIDYMRRLAFEAENRPSRQVPFRNAHLNQWTQSRSQWVDMSVYESNADQSRVFLESELEGQMAVGGLDLSATRDITAWVLLFPQEDSEDVRVLWRFWLPEAWINAHPTHILAEWAREGYIRLTPGDTIDHATIKKRILKDLELYNVMDIGYDRFHTSQLIQDITDETGVPVAPVGQGMMHMTAPTKELERRIAIRSFHHNNHPVARWMVDNVVLRVNGDNQKPDKKRSSDKIDGVSAALNAIDRLLFSEAMDQVEVNVSWV
jgi:phage terminase large subunit-like protein